MNISRYVKVGLFFVSLGVGGTFYVVRSSDGFSPFNTKTYEVIMEDASGLSTNSKIYMAGVPVGKIRSIDLQGERALLEIAFLDDVEIRQDAQLSRKSSSLLGTSILTLSPGTELTPIVREGERIESLSGYGDMSSVMDSAQVLSEQMSEMIAEFQERQLELLAVSLETFNSIARKLDERSDAELERVSRILENTALITERFESILRDQGEDLDVSTTEIRLALENLRAITDNVRGGEGTVGKALYDDALYQSLLVSAQRTEIAAEKLQSALDNIDSLAKNADKVVVEAGDIVSKAAGLGVEVDTHSRYSIASSDLTAAASLRIEPRTKDRWYRIGIAGVPDGVNSRTRSEETVNGSTTTITETSETKYGYAFDAELARRIGMVTLRGGMLESSAGIGIDFQPFSWLSLSGEMFDFGSDIAPNLRGSLVLYPFFDPESSKPWHWIYLKGGVNAALDDRRDIFIGAGMRFADEEVRGLVGLIPLAGN